MQKLHKYWRETLHKGRIKRKQNNYKTRTTPLFGFRSRKSLQLYLLHCHLNRLQLEPVLILKAKAVKHFERTALIVRTKDLQHGGKHAL